MENKLCFVQFIHPGGEHRPDAGRFKGCVKPARLKFPARVFIRMSVASDEILQIK
jgi:hypothetical protein